MIMKIKEKEPAKDTRFENFIRDQFRLYEKARTEANERLALCASNEQPIEAVVDAMTWLDGTFQAAANAMVAKHIIHFVWARGGCDVVRPTDLYRIVASRLIGESTRSKSSSATHRLMDACKAEAWSTVGNKLFWEFALGSDD